ncbi:immunity protein 39 of polymorphic toxin system [Prosthecobacter fusiformis]|uniref:Immunity protein 39 of polymorphic toxin system n=1 Tax=Prosthecobacter fusiformis TaxID=48464 RepID=A0A4R7RUP2_9BACT|nr:immunity protein 39 of polymorphic toxin system [Prosthecobacter fusiformis]
MKNGKRELLIGAVGLVKGSVKYGGKAMVNVCNELEPELERTKFLENAPFSLVSVIIRYGTKWGDVELGKINRRHAELEAAVEVPISEVRGLDASKLTDVVRTVVLETLVEVAMKYGLDQIFWRGCLKKSNPQ